jgi:hypothetical protein
VRAKQDGALPVAGNGRSGGLIADRDIACSIGTSRSRHRRGKSPSTSATSGVLPAIIIQVESTDGLKAAQEWAMKLNSTQLKHTLSQFDAEVLPDSHPAVPQLNDLFGDHTFFLDGSGLKVLELAETPEKETQTGEVVSLADWSDATLTSLRPHQPEPTGVVVVFEFKH